MKKEKLLSSDKKWKKKLTPQQYMVLREKGTEMPFTGELLHNNGTGRYTCAGCGAELFDSKTKFDSGTGWPSFDRAKKGAVKFHDDSKFGMKRIEVTCAKCGGHLGHVFDDGPAETTGKRFCINSCSLKFQKGKNKKVS